MPIPVIEVFCDYYCCQRRYVPLDLAFSRTVHRFQGLSAGPVDEGKIKNMYECIVLDPDVKAAEGRNTGLFYTGVSRGTTLGDEDGLNSAVYFQGDNLTRQRIQELTKKTNSDEEYAQVQRRRKWVQHLQKNTTTIDIHLLPDFKDTVEWIKTKMTEPVSYEDLHKQTSKYAEYLSKGCSASFNPTNGRKLSRKGESSYHPQLQRGQKRRRRSCSKATK